MLQLKSFPGLVCLIFCDLSLFNVSEEAHSEVRSVQDRRANRGVAATRVTATVFRAGGSAPTSSAVRTVFAVFPVFCGSSGCRSWCRSRGSGCMSCCRSRGNGRCTGRCSLIGNVLRGKSSMRSSSYITSLC